jgi:2-iminobutanoate/2-iminopropanoate deaminase
MKSGEKPAAWAFHAVPPMRSADIRSLRSVPQPVSPDERREMASLGILPGNGQRLRLPKSPGRAVGRRPVKKRALHASAVLNEAYAYARPASFSRALAVELGDKTLLLISGTASVGSDGATQYPGDFRAQLWRTYRNLTELLASAGATWHDVVRTSCYLRDIERDYKDFNEIRTAFFGWHGLDPLPASTGIQARLCREDLLVEIEAMAVFDTARTGRDGIR